MPKIPRRLRCWYEGRESALYLSMDWIDKKGKWMEVTWGYGPGLKPVSQFDVMVEKLIKKGAGLIEPTVPDCWGGYRDKGYPVTKIVQVRLNDGSVATALQKEDG